MEFPINFPQNLIDNIEDIVFNKKYINDFTEEFKLSLVSKQKQIILFNDKHSFYRINFIYNHLKEYNFIDE